MIYFIANEEQQIVKIGYTKNNPLTRLFNIQVGNPYILNIIGVMEGSISMERELHEKFKHLQLQGEWFSLNDEINQFILNMERENLLSKKYNTFYTKNNSPNINKNTLSTIRIISTKPNDIAWSDYGKFLSLVLLSDYQNRIAYSNGKPISRKTLLQYIDFMHIRTLNRFLNKLHKNNLIDIQKIDGQKFIVVNPDYASKLE